MNSSNAEKTKPPLTLKKLGFWTPGRIVAYSTILVLLALLLYPLRWFFYPNAYQAIRMGMSQREVLDAVGISPGDYTGGILPFYVLNKEQSLFKPAVKALAWQFNDHEIIVWFDDTGLVVSKAHYKADPLISPQEAMRRRFDRLYEGWFVHVRE